MAEKEPKKRLTPLPGAKILNANPGNQDAEKLAKEIEQLAQAESNTLHILTQATRANAETQEVLLNVLQDIRDLLVKAFQHASFPLPKHIQEQIIAGEYNPDEVDEEENDDESDNDDGGVTTPNE